MSMIKINGALTLANVGRFPGSADAMLERIPEAVATALTSKQLAHLLDALWDACQEAKGLAARDACSEGVVWDARRGELREIAA
jgi:hypothetical protein